MLGGRGRATGVEGQVDGFLGWEWAGGISERGVRADSWRFSKDWGKNVPGGKEAGAKTRRQDSSWSIEDPVGKPVWLEGHEGSAEPDVRAVVLWLWIFLQAFSFKRASEFREPVLFPERATLHPQSTAWRKLLFLYQRGPGGSGRPQHLLRVIQKGL